MAPRWSTNRSSRGDGLLSSPLMLVLIVVIVLAAGGGGFFLGKGSNNAETQVARSAIVEPSVDGMATAEPNEAGSVKAATSLLVGFPNLATSPTLDLGERVGQLIAPNAEASTLGSVNASISSIRTQLLTNGTTATGRVIVTPLSYKTVVGTDATVTVTVWYSTVLIDPSVNNVDPRFRVAYNTADLRMVHNDVGWQLLSFANQDGPAPDLFTLTGQAGDVSSIIPVINGSYPYRFALAP